jgi:hypothetical protein
MTTSIKTNYKNKQSSDWYFLSTTLSATTGIIIGLVIGNYLGWL